MLPFIADNAISLFSGEESVAHLYTSLLVKEAAF
jgi:hypothetical protein